MGHSARGAWIRSSLVRSLLLCVGVILCLLNFVSSPTHSHRGFDRSFFFVLLFYTTADMSPNQFQFSFSSESWYSILDSPRIFVSWHGYSPGTHSLNLGLHACLWFPLVSFVLQSLFEIKQLVKVESCNYHLLFWNHITLLYTVQCTVLNNRNLLQLKLLQIQKAPFQVIVYILSNW